MTVPSVFHRPAPCVPVHLPRLRLNRQVLAASRLCLLSAPAGFGKTTLLRECLAQLPVQMRYGWVSLDGRDLPLSAFCRQLALQFGLPSDLEPDALRQWLVHSAAPVCLILDDYPMAAGSELDLWLQQVLQGPESGLRLWVSCRQRPCWRFERLRLDGGIVELGSDSLALVRDEFDQLLPLLDEGLSAQRRDELWAFTQGWCAMVRLGLQSAAETPRPIALRQRDYVREEVFAHLDPTQRLMLAGIAHLPRLSSSLCVELWPEHDASRGFVAYLQSLGVLSPLDSEAYWWRLHPVMARALLDELPERAVSRLRLQACRLLRRAGFVSDAVELALQEGQVETAASYMERVPLAWLFAGQHLDRWLRWRERLSVSLLESTPFLIYLNAQALLISWRLEEAQVCIQRLAWQLPQPCEPHQRRLLANWEALQGTLLGLQGHAARAQAHCRSALESLESGDWHSIYLCYSTLARIAMAEGRGAECEDLLDCALGLARRRGCLVSELLIDTDRIRLLILAGQWDLASDLLRHDFELLHAQAAELPLLAGRLHVLAGELALLQGDGDGAESALGLGQGFARRCADPFILHAGAGLAEVALYRGDLPLAVARRQETLRHLQCMRVDPLCYERVLALLQLRLLARQKRWAQMLEPARELVAELHETGRLTPLNAPSLPLRAKQMLLVALQGMGHRSVASGAFQEWGQECRRQGFAGLLRARPEALSYVRQFESEAGEPLDIAPLNPPLERGLTPREMGVLRLLAEGLTNQEISGRLFISLNTVKAHTIHINHKLGVKRRTQAVKRARELGLLA